MDWWIWAVVGLVGFAVEAMTAGAFVYIFFGVAACITAIGVALGLLPELWHASLCFVALSAGSMAALRQKLVKRYLVSANPDALDTLFGETARPVVTLAPGATGRVELRGTLWTGVNADTVSLPAQSLCRVDRVDNLTLHIVRI